MAVFLLAKQNEEFLDTPVFQAGDSGQEDAVAVFTNRNLAQQYLDEADWKQDHEIGELDELQLLRWVVKAYEDGTHYLVINPDYQRQMAGSMQRVLIIEEQLAQFAESLTRELLTA
jgi:hypothetical protein